MLSTGLRRNGRLWVIGGLLVALVGCSAACRGASCANPGPRQRRGPGRQASTSRARCSSRGRGRLTRGRGSLARGGRGLAAAAAKPAGGAQPQSLDALVEAAKKKAR